MEMSTTEMQTTSWKHYSVPFLTGIVGLLSLISISVFVDCPYTPDSASYIEQARNFLSGSGFQSREWGLWNLDVQARPDPLFPPGYPIVIAVTAWATQMPAEIVAPWINRVSLSVLPLTLFLSTRKYIGQNGAAVIGALVAFSPGVINWGVFALTDLLSLTLVVAASGLLFAALTSKSTAGAMRLAFIGGALCGFTYTIRNVYSGFVLATFIFMFVWTIVTTREERWSSVRLSLFWSFGVCLVILPLFLRNFAVFGTIQPYQLPPSTIGVWQNVQDFSVAFLSEILGYPKLLTIADPKLHVLLLLLLLAAPASFLASPYRVRMTPVERWLATLSLFYVILGMVLTIAARSKYEWGELISGRHMIPYIAFMMIALFICLKRASSSVPALNYALLVLATILATFRFVVLFDQIEWRRWSTAQAHSVYQTILDLRTSGASPCSGDSDVLVVSNYAYLYRVVCDVNARHLEMAVQDKSSIVVSLADVLDKVKTRRALVLLHPGRGVTEGGLPLSALESGRLSELGWQVEINSRDSLMLSKMSNGTM